MRSQVIKFHTVQEYFEAGCRQFENGIQDGLTVALWRETRGKLCDGCPYLQRNCKAYAKLNLSPGSGSSEVGLETVRDEAARRGISIGEVRRQRSGS